MLGQYQYVIDMMKKEHFTSLYQYGLAFLLLSDFDGRCSLIYELALFLLPNMKYCVRNNKNVSKKQKEQLYLIIQQYILLHVDNILTNKEENLYTVAAKLVAAFYELNLALEKEDPTFLTDEIFKKYPRMVTFRRSLRRLIETIEYNFGIKTYDYDRPFFYPFF